MNAAQLWTWKIVQILHDPPGKPFASWYRDGRGRRGHAALAAELVAKLVLASEAPVPTRPDHAAAGADRPVLGTGRQVFVPWLAEAVVTHPLSAGPRLRLRDRSDPARVSPTEISAATLDALEALTQRAAPDAALPLGQDEDALKRTFWQLWRRSREDLLGLRVKAMGDAPWDEDAAWRALWQRMPADSRCPDVSVWDHTRVTSALAFMEADHSGSLPPEREPWLLSVNLGPVQQFIAESRTGRDLWVSSFLFADLAWHAMLPVVKRYGPDALLYPDLRGNPRVDRWIADHAELRDVLPDDLRDPVSFASLLPAHFVAVLPRGGGELTDLREIADACRSSMEQRWDVLCEQARRRLERVATQAGLSGWAAAWKEQTSQVIHLSWAAVPWEHAGDISGHGPGGGLPAQQAPAPASTMSPEQAQTLRDRAARLRPWTSDPLWARYEHAREVFGRTHGLYLGLERGFDYALTHHQLVSVHGARDHERPYPAEHQHQGDRCALCRHRAALGASASRPIDQDRQDLQGLWENLATALDLDTNEDRLCAVCLTKRLLTRRDRRDLENGRLSTEDFNRAWMGDRSDPVYPDGKLRAPFPSTAAIAAAAFLQEASTRADLQDELRAYEEACRDYRWPETLFPDGLAALTGSPGRGRDLLRFEPTALFPEAVEADGIRQKRIEEQACQRLLKASRNLSRKAGDQGPRRSFAVLAIDGDGLGRLIAGAPGAIGATWRDVLHPIAVKAVAERQAHTGWPGLLDQERLMGPSLHALISRALADFSHRIVPWVVEREHRGRLIYAGGDDVLALLPADEAIAAAARLQQLYSAPWVLDTRPGERAWSWREPNAPFSWDGARDRLRFLIPAPEADGPEQSFGLPLARRWPGVGESNMNKYNSTDTSIGAGGARGEILPMLGPNQSLSAGVAIAHYKTPMGAVLKQARDLESYAKHGLGRGAIAIARYTRGGPKYRFGCRWYLDGPHRHSPPAQQLLDEVRRAFATGRLPGRLPYKLREDASALEALDTDAEDAPRLMRGLLVHAADGASERDALLAALMLWKIGWDAEQRRVKHEQEQGRKARLNGEATVSGLLLCRALTRDDEEDGE